MNEIITLQSAFKITLTGLEIYGKPTFEQWLAQGEQLWYAKQSISWCLGDWLNYGEAAYGQKYSQVLDDTRYTLHSLQNIAYTCNAILPPARREGVSFSNHSEVASLAENEREYALDMLQSKQWNRDDVRAYKRTLKGESIQASKRALTITPEAIMHNGRLRYLFPEDIPAYVFGKPLTIYVDSKPQAERKAS